MFAGITKIIIAKKGGVLCVGSASKDVFFPTREGKIIKTPKEITSKVKIAFELGAKFHIDKRHEALGGCASNVAAGLARLGEDASCYALIGGDETGMWVLKKLKDLKIGTQLVDVKRKAISDLSSILIDQKSGERIIFSNQEVNKDLEIKPERMHGFGWVFIGDLNGDWKGNLREIFEGAKRSNAHLAYNPRQKNIHDNPRAVISAIKKCEIVFMNKDEAIELALAAKGLSRKKANNEVNLITFFQKMGPRIVVITDGLRGAWAADYKSIFHAGALKQKALDTTGAGDAFNSGFFASILKGGTISQSLAWGISNSASAVKFYGANEGLLNKAEIEKWAKKVKISKMRSVNKR